MQWMDSVPIFCVNINFSIQFDADVGVDAKGERTLTSEGVHTDTCLQ